MRYLIMGLITTMLCVAAEAQQTRPWARNVKAATNVTYNFLTNGTYSVQDALNQLDGNTTNILWEIDSISGGKTNITFDLGWVYVTDVLFANYIWGANSNILFTYNAGTDMSGSTHNMLFNYHSGSYSTNCIWNAVLGWGGMNGSSGIENSLILGKNSGQYSDTCKESVTIAPGSMSYSTNVYYGTFLSQISGRYMSGVSNVLAGGYGALQYTTDSRYLVGIGPETLTRCSMITNCLGIGRYAGRYATNWEDTIFIDMHSSAPAAGRNPENDAIVIQDGVVTLGRGDGSKTNTLRGVWYDNNGSLVNRSAYGLIEGLYVGYSNTVSVKIEPGYMFNQTDFVKLYTNYYHSMTGLLSGADFHYIYLDESECTFPSNLVFYDSSAEPTWSDNYHGYYLSNDRFIGSVYSTNGTATIHPFKNYGNEKKVSPLALGAVNAGSIWNEPTISASDMLPVTAYRVKLYSDLECATTNDAIYVYLSVGTPADTNLVSTNWYEGQLKDFDICKTNNLGGSGFVNVCINDWMKLDDSRDIIVWASDEAVNINVFRIEAWEDKR